MLIKCSTYFSKQDRIVGLDSVRLVFRQSTMHWIAFFGRYGFSLSVGKPEKYYVKRFHNLHSDSTIKQIVLILTF